MRAPSRSVSTLPSPTMFGTLLMSASEIADARAWLKWSMGQEKIHWSHQHTTTRRGDWFILGVRGEFWRWRRQCKGYL